MFVHYRNSVIVATLTSPGAVVERNGRNWFTIANAFRLHLTKCTTLIFYTEHEHQRFNSRLHAAIQHRDEAESIIKIDRLSKI